MAYNELLEFLNAAQDECPGGYRIMARVSGPGCVLSSPRYIPEAWGEMPTPCKEDESLMPQNMSVFRFGAHPHTFKQWWPERGLGKAMAVGCELWVLRVPAQYCVVWPKQLICRSRHMDQVLLHRTHLNDL